MKRIFRFIISCSLIVTISSLAFPTVASTLREKNEFYYEIVDGGAVVRWYNGNSESVVIPDFLDGFPVLGLGYREENTHSPSYSNNLISITLPNSLRFIGSTVFSHCSRLQTINIPPNVESIGRSAFENCSELELVVLPENLNTIGDRAFGSCEALRAITIPKSVKTIGKYSFSYCFALESAEILSDSVGYGMFWRCLSLKSVILSDNVKTIDVEAFRKCSSLTSINVPKSVTLIDYLAFAETGLKEIIINNRQATFQEKPAAEMNPHYPTGATFGDCFDLETIYSFRGSQAQSYSQRKDVGFTPIANVSVNGKELALDIPAVIENDRVLVPMRAIFEEIGATVAWDDATQTATATRGQAITSTKAAKSLSFSVGSSTMLVDGKSVPLDVPSQMLFDRTMAPVRAVSESLGAKVEWDEAKQTVIITTAY